MMPLISSQKVIPAREIIMTGHNHDSATAAMIDGRIQVGGAGAGAAGSDHRPTAAEVVYRIATMTAVIFLLFSVI
jgi:hypothetical protein